MTRSMNHALVFAGACVAAGFALFAGIALILAACGYQDSHTRVHNGCVEQVHRDVWGHTVQVDRVCP